MSYRHNTTGWEAPPDPLLSELDQACSQRFATFGTPHVSAVAPCPRTLGAGACRTKRLGVGRGFTLRRPPLDG
jgi:hypothetical protein